MNQNRNNNRRRGRGNNRGQGGGNQGNRIDSRARGNAPQLLEKYRKLAHDASLNGDRVQTEYYLQFADHYFRVVADSRTQRDEQRPRYDRETSQDYDDEDEDEQQVEAARSPRQPSRREREDETQEGQPAIEGERADEGEDNNPFVRESRTRRPRQRRGQSSAAAEENAAAENGAPAEEAGGFDPGVLPPAIGRNAEEPEQKPRGRRKRSRPAESGDSETLEAVG